LNLKLKLPRFDDPPDTASARSAQAEMRFLDATYRRANGGAKPIVLREDFCGAFANSCAWVMLGPERRAVAVDPDPTQIAYGCVHNRGNLKPPQQVRVQIVQANVYEPGLPKADVIAALGFRHFALKTRVELLTYFRNCLQTLEPGGLLAVDCFGGTEARKAREEPRVGPGATYAVEQEGFDPLTHEAVFHIHRRRRGDIKRRTVWSSNWRIWTLPELKEALLDAGFDRAWIYWRREAEGEGEFDFVAVEQVEEEPSSWTSYVVGFR
jgi:SAM-dependent methyltransferase